MFKSRLKKSFISMLVIVMGSFFTITIVGVARLTSQIGYSTERSMVEAQSYYNAYAGIQKAIYEIRQNKDYTGWNYFSLDKPNIENVKQSNSYGQYGVLSTNINDIYTYTITGEGYGKFKGEIITTKLEAQMVVYYDEDEPLYQIGKFTVN